MTVDHLKMLHTAGGKGMPLQFCLGLCVVGGAEGAANAVWIGAVPICFCFGGGERTVCGCQSVHLEQHIGSWTVNSSPQPSSNCTNSPSSKCPTSLSCSSCDSHDLGQVACICLLPFKKSLGNGLLKTAAM